MKTFIILVLILLLAAAAFFTRPSESSFRDMVKLQAEQKSGNFVEDLFSGMSSESYLDDCTYKDKFLWTEIEKDGKTIYLGAFSHWFEKGADKVKVKKTTGTPV